MDVFVRAPWLAFVVGAILFGAVRSAGLTMAIAAAGIWFFYGVYESLMRFRVLCSGECNIRVDLLLIYPILLILSVIAVGAAFKRRRG
jgi:hypothetical protein